MLGGTATCAVAAMAHRTRPLMAVQFHPEVAHTQQGNQILANFVFGVCGCVKDWDPKDRIGPIEKEIRAVAAGPQRFLLRQRRRGFHGRLHAVPASARAGARLRYLCRHRA